MFLSPRELLPEQLKLHANFVDDGFFKRYNRRISGLENSQIIVWKKTASHHIWYALCSGEIIVQMRFLQDGDLKQ